MFPALFVYPHENRGVEITALHGIDVIPDDKIVLVVRVEARLRQDRLECHEWCTKTVLLLPLLVHVVADFSEHLAEAFSAFLL